MRNAFRRTGSIHERGEFLRSAAAGEVKRLLQLLRFGIFRDDRKPGPTSGDTPFAGHAEIAECPLDQEEAGDRAAAEPREVDMIVRGRSVAVRRRRQDSQVPNDLRELDYAVVARGR